MKLLKKDMKNGVPKEEAFASFCERGGDSKKGSRLLASVPDSEESEKYSNLNYGLIGIYILMFALGFMSVIPMLTELSAKALVFVLGISLLIPSAVVWMLIKKQALGYVILCFFLLKGILDSFKDENPDQNLLYIGIAINLAIMGYAIFLKLKLFPFQNFFNTRKDDNGVFIYKKNLTKPSA